MTQITCKFENKKLTVQFLHKCLLNQVRGLILILNSTVGILSEMFVYENTTLCTDLACHHVATSKLL